MKLTKLLFLTTALFLLLMPGCNQAPSSEDTDQKQPRRPENFEPFHYKYTIEELYENFSEDMMERAAVDVQKLREVNEEGPYKGTVESLGEHPIPEWFDDAKLGIFLDWGPWSVAGYATPRDPELGTGGSYPDWYEFLMDNAYKAYHDSVWGADFRRDDFLPLLTGSNFDADMYLDLAVDAGAKYFVPFCRHHGGWALWESQYTFRNAVEMGPGRDIYREITTAARERDMKLGLYFSVSEWEYPVIVDSRVTQWDPTEHLGVFKDRLGLFLQQAYPTAPEYVLTGFFPAVMDRMCSGKIPVRDYFTDYMMPLCKEAIDKYDPDLLWYDIAGSPINVSHTPEVSAYFYNQAEDRKEVVINNRGGSSLTSEEMKELRELMAAGEQEKAMQIYMRAARLGDYGTPEYNFEETASDGSKWEVCRSISPAFGYNWTDNEENSLTGEELVEMFVKIVAGNGNLLLMINPDGSGGLSELQKNRLLELGEWLKVNGEGVYATRAWQELKEDENYFTQNKDGEYVYVHCLNWPGNELILSHPAPEEGAEITMLGVEGSLQWEKSGEQLTIRLPDNLQDEDSRPCNYVWVIKIPV
jgi:alpha-L-fucosidase